MITIRDYIKKCKHVLSTVLDEQERIIMNNELKIIQLNTSQIDEGMGSDGGVLKNKDKKYSGRYTLATQFISQTQTVVAPKVAGELYNFAWDGDFLSGMQIDLDPSLSKINIFSTGTGTGEKSIFFTGYTNLFGLDDKNAHVLNYEIIYPELMKYIKKYL